MTKVIARLRMIGHDFEILVDCDKALEFKEKGDVPLGDILVTEGIYKDVKRGERASEHDIQKAFGTTDERKVAEIIVKKGQVQLTQEHRDKEREEKRKQVINIIHRNAIDSKTGLPHPPQRIENAMDEAGINIDENKSAEAQVEGILKKLTRILPLKFEVRNIEIGIPAKFAGQSFNVLKKYAKIEKSDWQNNGSLISIVKVPAGIQDEFFSELNKVCHGEIESKILKKE